MTVHSTEISVPARLAELAALQTALAERAAGFGLTPDQLGHLQLIVEELFTNTVKHGHRGDSIQRVELRLELDESALHLCYSDDAPAFDPLADAPAAGDERAGFGLALIRGLCRKARYVREQGRNRLFLEL